MVMTTKQRLQKKIKDRGVTDENIPTPVGIKNIVEIVIEEQKLFKQNYPKTVIQLAILEESFESKFRVYICIKVLSLIEKLQNDYYKDIFIKNIGDEIIDIACSYYIRACFSYYKIMSETGYSFETIIKEADIFNEDEIMKKMKKQNQF